MIGVLMTAALSATPESFGWMVGNWLSCSNGEMVQEHWMGPSPLGLVAVSLTTRGAKANFEFLRVMRQGDGWAYVSSPNGRYPPTPFQLTKLEPGSAVFENPAHDFPKRIIYSRKDDVLTASIDDGAGKGPSWSYRLKTSAADSCP